MSSNLVRTLFSLSGLVFGCLISPVCADVEIDARPWHALPVFHEGRVMPMDTFSHEAVLTICGREYPLIDLRDAAPNGNVDSSMYRSARLLFSEKELSRKFTPHELLFSWIVEPEKWEAVPFLLADNKDLREKILNLPVHNSDGNRLRYVSPQQLKHCQAFFDRWEEVQKRTAEEGKSFKLVGLDLQVKKLAEAYSRYRELTWRPSISSELPARFPLKVRKLADAVQSMAKRLQKSSSSDKADVAELMKRVADPLQEILLASQSEFPDHVRLDSAAVSLRSAIRGWAKPKLQEADKAKAGLAAELIHAADEVSFALYDNGAGVYILPSLDSASVETNRADFDSRPWLPLSAFVEAPTIIVIDYPQKEYRNAQNAFDRLVYFYKNREEPDRVRKINESIAEFAKNLRILAEAVDPLRAKLPAVQIDQAALAATAYPPPGYADYELIYNDVDPFFWSWIVALAALVCLAMAWGFWKHVAFWTGVALLVLAQLGILCGFALRMAITKIVPLTGMFETILLVAFSAALFGTVFALLPVLQPGLRRAWKLTTVPVSVVRLFRFKVEQETSRRDEEIARSVALAARIAIAFGVFYLLCWMPSATGHPYFSLKLSVSAGGLTLIAIVAWAVRIAVAALCIYYVPRAVACLAVGLYQIPRSWFLELGRDALRLPFERKAFAIVGAALAFLAAMAAYYAPSEIAQKGIASPLPILRDNFWLSLHVLTIGFSYGAGALAWGLGNISLAYYLFGKYRSSQSAADNVETKATEKNVAESSDYAPSDPVAAPLVRHAAPQECVTLAGYVYKATQVAVLLLVAGTIFGALWADVAWGRFWGWDAKEVWSLITLLVYMAILHARYVGWSGNFGIAVGSVFGFTAIIMTWYGVNFLFGSGLHSYASGAGGRSIVTLLVMLNWVFALFAAVRYTAKMSGGKSVVSAENA